MSSLFYRKSKPPVAPKPAPPSSHVTQHSARYQQAPPQQNAHRYSQSAGQQQWNSNQGYSDSYGQPQYPNRANEAFLRPIFNRVDKDRSGSIDVHELRLALINGNYDQFDLDTVKMLMNMFDTDRSGTITFNEFIGLFKYIEDWQNVFRHWDTDRSGAIDERELAGALNGFGYALSPDIIRAIITKYSNQPVGFGAPLPSVSFDRFVRACVATKELTDAFRSIDRDNDGWIQVNYDQFMQMVLRAP